MSNMSYFNILIGLIIPFIGTTLGASTIFLMKRKLGKNIENLLLGFASGVMIAASVWSLLIPSIDMAKSQEIISWLPASCGFLLGILFLLLLDYIIPHIHNGSNLQEGIKSSLSKEIKLTLAVTLHNIPEGMAVGIVFAGVISGENLITLAQAFALSIGIAIQNFPEGAIISMPLKSAGKSSKKSFFMGTLSGIVEPIFGLITVLLANFIKPILPYLLSFAAGAMIYVVTEELIPSSHDDSHSNLCIIGLSLGFVLMMILDVALS